MICERIDLRLIAPQPWKNGAGMTREIAVGGADASNFDWRISVAALTCDAPFSAYPGIDRCITLLHGAGMRLRSDDGRIDHRLDAFAPFSFSGDVALTATLIDGACDDLNVMTRRGQFYAELGICRNAQELPCADVSLVLCSAGEWLADGETLGAQQGLLWHGPRAVVRVRPTRPRGVLLQVRLHRHPAS